MSEEEVFKKTLSITIERLARQVMNYEIEIANLNAQLISLSESVKSLSSDKEDS